MNNVRSGRPTVGVLALQGDFAAHRRVLEERLGVAVRDVRRPADLAEADSLILPGGESTTMGMLLDRIGLVEPIRERARAGMPVYGTCAGMILMAAGIEDRPNQPTLGLLDITVARNAFGRQVDSFEAEIPISGERPR
ncbi:MAG TPA: pyridoxal 5'-phosphate synthase glutaminase subunit PdxT, partial [Chthonomonadaceae bacterium]|nr:pyridoxal 5'-phosphate synthase glutaminase subunit PdxT [Chthonomonadaceae bacterium]